MLKVPENVTQGKFACKLTFPNDGDWPGLHFVKFDGNWEGYDVLKVDVFNPSTEIVALNMSLCDKDSGITKEAYFGEYNKRYNASAILKPGKNTIEFELGGVTVETMRLGPNRRTLYRHPPRHQLPDRDGLYAGYRRNNSICGNFHRSQAGPGDRQAQSPDGGCHRGKDGDSGRSDGYGGRPPLYRYCDGTGRADYCAGSEW